MLWQSTREIQSGHDSSSSRSLKLQGVNRHSKGTALLASDPSLGEWHPLPSSGKGGHTLARFFSLLLLHFFSAIPLWVYKTPPQFVQVSMYQHSFSLPGEAVLESRHETQHDWLMMSFSHQTKPLTSYDAPNHTRECLYTQQFMIPAFVSPLSFTFVFQLLRLFPLSVHRMAGLHCLLLPALNPRHWIHPTCKNPAAVCLLSTFPLLVGECFLIFFFKVISILKCPLQHKNTVKAEKQSTSSSLGKVVEMPAN